MKSFQTKTIRAGGACAAAVCLMAAGTARAQMISMTGDLGTASMVGTASPISMMNTTNTTTFAWAGAGGNITGDVNVSNDPTGTIFTMTITNLTFNATAPGSSGAGTDVTIVVDHLYESIGNGTYNASHALSGNWTVGGASYIQLDSIQDVGYANQPLSTLLATSSPFALSNGAAVAVSSGAGKYGIQATLQFHADTLGSMFLPTSAHITVAFVPAPGAVGVLGVAGLMGMRRRR